MNLAKTEAKLLHDKISKKAYNDDDLIRIFATRSRAQTNATFNHYKDEFGKDINKVRNVAYLALLLVPYIYPTFLSFILVILMCLL